MESSFSSEKVHESLSLEERARRVVGAAGGAVECAERLRAVLPANQTITHQAVAKWTRIPAERVPFLELIQRYDRYFMRPDVYGERPTGGDCAAS